MGKVILLTGATDGIGFETAKMLAAKGHTLLLHGRNESKLSHTKSVLAQQYREIVIETHCSDFSNLADVEAFASVVQERYSTIDVLINNAGVFKTPHPITSTGYDIRFIVNTIAPYLLTRKILPVFNSSSRVINLSSAAQASVNLRALNGDQILSDSDAYAQSKLALTMWTFQLARILGNDTPAFIAVNPASFLGSKMVKEAYGHEGKDLHIGANILIRAALSDDFSGFTGQYFDNDRGTWTQPHPDALDEVKNKALITAIEQILIKQGINNI